MKMHLRHLIRLSTFLLATTSTATLTGASPLINKRAENDEFCGTEASKQVGDYNVYNNLVGRSESGKQCTQVLQTESDNGISWRTTWSWSGEENHIKSFANAAYHFEPKAISEITSIPLTWDWTYTTSSGEDEETKSNVMLDMWTYPSPDITGNYAYEITVWFGATGGARPLGNPLIDSPFVGDDGIEYQVYGGTNTVQTVFSFVASGDSTNSGSFKGDLLPFILFLQQKGYLIDSQYLGAIRGGTNAYVGNNVEFTTTEFSVQVN